jgi:hypothetical protein
LLKHVNTRWLSLYPAITRLLENIDQVVIYFLREEKDECEKIITDFGDKETRNDNFVTSPEVYLYFVQHFMLIFHETILKLELESLNSNHLYGHMIRLRNVLENRKSNKQFGSKVEEKIKLFSKADQDKFLKEADSLYNRAIKYLDKNLDDSKQNLYSKLQNLDMERDLNYKDLIYV